MKRFGILAALATALSLTPMAGVQADDNDRPRHRKHYKHHKYHGHYHHRHHRHHYDDGDFGFSIRLGAPRYPRYYYPRYEYYYDPSYYPWNGHYPSAYLYWRD